MKISIRSAFFVFVLLSVLLFGCSLLSTPVPTLPPPLPTNTSVPTNTSIPATNTSAELNPAWLIMEEDINGFSNEIGISNWQLDQETPGNSRICRIFTGTSWSISPNFAMNCINQVSPDSTFEEVIASMYDLGILYSTDIALTPTLSYDYDYALYTHMADDGHSVYDAFLVSDDLLFRASVNVGMPVGYTPETLFDEQGEIIEAFLKNILMINLDKVGGNP